MAVNTDSLLPQFDPMLPSLSRNANTLYANRLYKNSPAKVPFCLMSPPG